jgi:hypothetical protein
VRRRRCRLEGHDDAGRGGAGEHDRARFRGPRRPRQAQGSRREGGGRTSGAESKRAAEGLEPVWQPIEGTVRKNEPDLYLDVEDSFQRLESGDLDNAKKGARALNGAIDAYLAKHRA